MVKRVVGWRSRRTCPGAVTLPAFASMPAVSSSQFKASMGSRVLDKQGYIGSHHCKKEEGEEEVGGALCVGRSLVVFTHVLRSSQLHLCSASGVSVTW